RNGMVTISNQSSTTDSVQGPHVPRVGAENVIEGVSQSKLVSGAGVVVHPGESARSVVSSGIFAGRNQPWCITELIQSGIDDRDVRLGYRDKPGPVQILTLDIRKHKQAVAA